MTEPTGQFPKPPEKRTLNLPGGATLTGLVDLPPGVGEDCKVSFNLLLQLGPLLGNLECLLRIMKFLGWLLDFVNKVAPTPDPIGLARQLEKLPPIAKDLEECIVAFTPGGMCPPVKQILQLIASYVQCLIDLIESITEQQVTMGVQMGEAEGNPQLQEVLQLAQDNADKLGMQALSSCEPVFGLLQMMGSLLELVGAGGIQVPSLDQFAGGAVGEFIQPLKDMVETLNLVADALPC